PAPLSLKGEGGVAPFMPEPLRRRRRRRRSSLKGARAPAPSEHPFLAGLVGERGLARAVPSAGPAAGRGAARRAVRAGAQRVGGLRAFVEPLDGDALGRLCCP